MSGIWIGAAAIAGAAVGLPAVVVALVVGSLHWTFRKWRAPLWIALLLAALLGAYRGNARPEEAGPESLARATAFRGIISERPKVRGGSQSFLIEIESAHLDDQWMEMSGSIVVTTALQPRVFAGDSIYVTGGAKRVEDLIGEPRDYVRSLNADGSTYAPRVVVNRTGSGIGYQVQKIAAGISERLQRAVPGDPGILLSGLVMGDDTRLSSARRAAFINTGTTHITAVSGSNFALLIVILTWVGRNTGTRRRFWFQAGAVTAVWSYAALVGFGPPAVRAALVASAALVGIRFGRRPDFVTLIVLAAALDALVRPADVFRLSYQLSTASALALALVLPGLNPRGFAGWIVAAVISTFAADLATLPFLLPVFGRTSWASVPANALIEVPAALAFFLAMAASVLLPVWPLGGEAVAGVAGMFAQAVLAIVDTLGRDHALTNVPVTGLMSAIGLTTICIGSIAAMSRDCRIATRTIAGQLLVPNWTVVIALAGAICGVVLGLLAWSLH